LAALVLNMRFSDQYFWNIVFALLFLAFIITGGIILESEAYRPMTDVTVFEFVILALATFRLTRLFVYDKITAFFREQFYDVVELKTKRYLEKPARGPRRTLADLLSCPWCTGVWFAATVVFFYYLTPYAWYPILFLAIAGVATTLQLLANMIGWQAEKLKMDVGE